VPEVGTHNLLYRDLDSAYYGDLNRILYKALKSLIDAVLTDLANKRAWYGHAAKSVNWERIWIITIQQISPQLEAEVEVTIERLHGNT
jgi:hypothetical protein